jgi:hypothetical protein
MSRFGVSERSLHLISAAAIVASPLAFINSVSAQACQWMMSSGGTSDFENLATGPPLSELAFGDFDGDGKTDVFAVSPIGDGNFQWMMSPGGTGAFRDLAIGPALSELRFGDFDGDGKTDVVAVKCP